MSLKVALAGRHPGQQPRAARVWGHAPGKHMAQHNKINLSKE